MLDMNVTKLWPQAGVSNVKSRFAPVRKPDLDVSAASAAPSEYLATADILRTTGFKTLPG